MFAAAIVWAGHGVTAVVCLPTLSHGAFVLRRRWVLLIAALQAANLGVVTWRSYGWEVSLRSVTEFAAAETFVVAFTWLAAGERRARRELAAANRKLAEYATQSEELATAQERNRLARELHDSLGHYLTVVHVQIQAAASQLELAPSRARQALTKAARLTHEGLEDVRRSVAALRASPMHGRPLAASNRRAGRRPHGVGDARGPLSLRDGASARPTGRADRVPGGPGRADQRAKARAGQPRRGRARIRHDVRAAHGCERPRVRRRRTGPFRGWRWIPDSACSASASAHASSGATSRSGATEASRSP